MEEGVRKRKGREGKRKRKRKEEEMLIKGWSRKGRKGRKRKEGKERTKRREMTIKETGEKEEWVR